MAARLDPRTKQVIRDQLRDELYGSVDRRYGEGIDALIDRNNLLTSTAYDAFTYKGDSYQRTPNLRLIPGTPRLHTELHETLNTLNAEREQIRTEEEPFVVGYFTKALNRSNSIQDYFFLIPECLHSTLRLFSTDEWKASHWWHPREMSDEEVEAFKEKHEPWLAKLRYRMMLDLLLN